MSSNQSPAKQHTGWRSAHPGEWQSAAVWIERRCACGEGRKFFPFVTAHTSAFICSECCAPYRPLYGECVWPDADCMECGFPLVSLSADDNPQPEGWWSALCAECGKRHSLPSRMASVGMSSGSVFDRLNENLERARLYAAEPGWVYVMLDLVTKQVKVGGTSREPAARWAEHPRGLLPLFATFCHDWRACEKSAHKQLSRFRVSKEEWFDTSPSIATHAVIKAVRRYSRPVTMAAKGAAA